VDMWTGDEEFNKKCGEILYITLNIEHVLDEFISAYCGFSGSYEQIVHGVPTVFQTPISKKNIHKILYLIQPRLSFQNKLDIFEEICKAERINEQDNKSILKKIKKIQNLRNMIAHAERFFVISDEPRLLNKRRRFIPLDDYWEAYFKEGEEAQALTDGLVKEIKQDQENIIQYLYPLLNKILKQNESKRT